MGHAGSEAKGVRPRDGGRIGYRAAKGHDVAPDPQARPGRSCLTDERDHDREQDHDASSHGRSPLIGDENPSNRSPTRLSMALCGLQDVSRRDGYRNFQ